MKILKLALLLTAALAGLWSTSVGATHLIYWQDGYFFNPRMPGASTLCVVGDTDQATANWIRELVSGPQGWAPVGYSLSWPTNRLLGDTTVAIKVTDVGGIPSSVAAVALNLTATESTQVTHLTVYPSDAQRPETSSLNLSPGQTVANYAIVKVGTDGNIFVYNRAGEVHLIIDVSGWFDNDGNYHALTPARILDTRQHVGACDVTVSFEHLGDTWWAAQVFFQDIEKVDRGGPAYAVKRFTVQVNADHWTGYSAWSKQLVISHEFGHIVGPLGDHAENSNCSWLMSYCWIVNQPSATEIQVVRSLYAMGLPSWVQTTGVDIWRGVVTGGATAVGAALMFGLGGLAWKRIKH